MKKEEVTAYINGAYPSFDKNLLSIENQLLALLDYYRFYQSDLFIAGDFRPGTIGRMISSVICTRFFLNNTAEFIQSENWDNIFQKNYLPEPFKGNGYFGHFMDIDVQLRFSLFHQFYHQLETTHRIICRTLNLTDHKKKPIERVNDITCSFSSEFIEFFEAVRNTIHNNGYYHPVGKHQRKEFTFELPPYSLTFKGNQKIELGTEEILFTIKKLLENLKHMLMHNAIQKIEIIIDKN
ncbi:MAG: hypothetical protein Q8S14_07760 [Algoriphagus sp.]|uniref:hypothetical protein n=1 Tax=Algoriphagus sp. TaxID=1872435 RepID=UPI002734C638|nr:hypothetical protein [Algoriphagus sp.]MDP3471757.1 hypothetical protein [Algoriphagus sp.]